MIIKHDHHMIMILKSMIAYIAVPETEPAGQTVFTGVSLDDKDTGTNSQVIMQHKIWVGMKNHDWTQVRLRCTEESSPDACDTFEIFAERRGEGTYRS